MSSIIEQTAEKEKQKRIKELKRKREMERLERERREREQQYQGTKQVQTPPRKKFGIRLPNYENKVEQAIESKDDERQSFSSLPDNFMTKKPRKPSPESVWGGGAPQPPQPQQQFPPPPPPQEQAPPPEQYPPQQQMQPPQQMAPPPQQQWQGQMMQQQAPPNLGQLIDKSTKEQLMDYFSNIIRNSTITYLPGLNQGKFKFPDYGYRRLIELLIENKDFLRIFIDLEDIQGVNFVKISQFIRPMDNPADEGDEKVLGAENSVRGIEALCDILYNGEAEMDPYENEWKHLNKVLDCFSQPDVKGRQRSWKIETEKAVLSLSSSNTGISIEYKAVVKPK
ncbi:MAG: hypothetical protein ACMUIE_09230 [Thermoplasmatota archaeon]